MEGTEKSQGSANARANKAGTLGVVIILGFVGYTVLFGMLFFGLAASGESAWYIVYIPLLAIPGAFLGPAFLAWRKRSSG